MKKLFTFIPKVNSNSYGGIWIAAGIVISVVIPSVVWFLFHIFIRWLCIIGGVNLAAFFVMLENKKLMGVITRK
jgi:hypothetical protein